uniref:Uncharacterized protein n=1 Tax=Clytia hemisphaerica TaxID=252671 RepID=A0A7M5XBB2_9CNID
MDSAHGDERNLAHVASGRNVQKVADDQQIIKLKEEHGREIQKLNYESKIELMEAQMKNVSLEKDNQTLGHRLEMLKLKNSHEAETKQVAADKDLQNKLTEMEKQLAIKDKEISDTKNQMAVKENECKIKLMTKDQEMLEKENEIKEKDATIQTLQNEIEKLKRSHNPTESKMAVTKEKHPHLFTKEEKFAWGADVFFGFREMRWEESAYESYEAWYIGISSVLTNRRQVTIISDGTKYVFMKKHENKTGQRLFIGFREKVRYNYTAQDYEIIFEGLSEETMKNGRFLLLHPKVPEKRLKFVPYQYDKDWWNLENVTEDYYSGNEQSVIILVF